MKILAGIRLLFVFICLAIYIAIYLPLDFLFSFSQKTKFRIRSRFARFAYSVFGYRLETVGNQSEDCALIVANHRSLFDPFMIADKIHAYIVAKSEVEGYPVIGTAAAFSGVIFVVRADKNSRNSVKLKIRELLQNGKSVFIFPEGTTTDEKLTAQFKKGSFEMAHDLGIPVVPVSFEYKHRSNYWTSGSIVKHALKELSRWNNPCKMVIHEPIKADTVENLMDKVLEKIHGDILEYHNYEQPEKISL